jgi:Protein of unknown function (DUF1403)
MIDSTSPDSTGLSAPRPVPAWARNSADTDTPSDAAFRAGAALATLDALMRSEQAWAGAWTQRLALRAAAASCRHLGRTEDEATLRDLWLLRSPGADPGPPGRVLDAWHRLARYDALTEEGLQAAAHNFGLGDAFAVDTLVDALDQLKGANRPLASAAAAASAVKAAAGEGASLELLALWAADAVLARVLRWPRAVPLLAAEVLQARGGGRRVRPGEAEWERAVSAGYARAAAHAADLASDLAHRSDKLKMVAPKLRSKNARPAIEALLREDAITPALARGRLSDRAARRLFDRLVTLGGVRELSGRPTFRVYGL